MISSVSPGGFVRAVFAISFPLFIKVLLFSTLVMTGGGFAHPFARVKFLDLWFHVGWSEIETSLIVKNNLCAYTGDKTIIAKNRFPIPTGDFSADTLRLTSDFKGRLARFRHIDSTRTQFVILLFIGFTELDELGF